MFEAVDAWDAHARKHHLAHTRLCPIQKWVCACTHTNQTVIEPACEECRDDTHNPYVTDEEWEASRRERHAHNPTTFTG